MDPRYIDYSRVVAVMAQQDVLSPDVATGFCKAVLPQLIAELEVLQRLADTKFSSVFTIDAPTEPPAQACEATVCSSRWAAGEAKPAKQAKKVKKTRKARKPKNDHSTRT